MGLWVGHLAGDQGTGFNPDSVLLSSERFPCHPLCCLFGRPCVGREGCALSPGVCGCSRGAVSWHGRSGVVLLRGVRLPHPPARGQRNFRSFLLGWRVQLIYGQALEWPEREAGCQQLSRGRTRIPRAPLSGWGTSVGRDRHLTSLFYCYYY